MADTLEFALTEGAWTDISSTAGLEAYMTNGSSATIYYLQSESAPPITTTSYHRLNPAEAISYSITLPEVIYARSTQPNGKLAATPGLI